MLIFLPIFSQRKAFKDIELPALMVVETLPLKTNAESGRAQRLTLGFLRKQQVAVVRGARLDFDVALLHAAFRKPGKN